MKYIIVFLLVFPFLGCSDDTDVDSGVPNDASVDVVLTDGVKKEAAVNTEASVKEASVKDAPVPDVVTADSTPVDSTPILVDMPPPQG